MAIEINQVDVTKLELKPGDTLHVRLGGDIYGEPWIPGPEEVLEAQEAFRRAVPDNVYVIVTHQFVNATIVGLNKAAESLGEEGSDAAG